MLWSVTMLNTLSLFLSISAAGAAAPRMQSLGTTWPNQPLRAMPLVQNYWGGATLRRDIVEGGGLIGMGPITLTPFDGNFLNSTLFINEAPLRVKV